MPLTTRLLPPANTLVQEPVDLALANAHVRADLRLNAAGDGPADDASGSEKAEVRYLQHCLTAARELVENHTGLYLAGSQRLQIVFDLSEDYLLPAGAVAQSVSGFFTTLAELAAWSLEEYRKGISVNRQLHLGEARNTQYTVVVDLPADPVCPAIATSAILELAAEFYRNRETSSSAGIVPRELPVSWRVKLAPLVVKPVLH